MGFQPDFVWIKERSSTSSHRIFDSIRGATNYLAPDGTGAQATAVSTLKSFTKDGFTLGSNDGTTNQDGQSFISWTWKAGGVPSAIGKSAKLQNCKLSGYCNFLQNLILQNLQNFWILQFCRI